MNASIEHILRMLGRKKGTKDVKTGAQLDNGMEPEYKNKSKAGLIEQAMMDTDNNNSPNADDVNETPEDLEMEDNLDPQESEDQESEDQESPKGHLFGKSPHAVNIMIKLAHARKHNMRR